MVVNGLADKVGDKKKKDILVILWLSTGEGLCGQMVASGLGDKVGDTNEKKERRIFWSFYGRLPEKLF
jgi:hypothetical protein